MVVPELLLLLVVPAVLLTAYWVWMLVDAIRVPDAGHRAGDRLVWVLVIVLTGWIGAVVHRLVGRPRAG